MPRLVQTHEIKFPVQVDVDHILCAIKEDRASWSYGKKGYM